MVEPIKNDGQPKKRAKETNRVSNTPMLANKGNTGPTSAKPTFIQITGGIKVGVLSENFQRSY